MAVRITGFSTPVGGVGWEYSDRDKDVVGRVVDALGDYRVLLQPPGREDYEYCRLAAQKIRDYMKLEIPNVKRGGHLAASLKTIQAAARDFVSAAGPYSDTFKGDHLYFVRCLEAMRLTIGREVAWMASFYKVSVDEHFAHSLPLQDLDWIPGFEQA